MASNLVIWGPSGDFILELYLIKMRHLKRSFGKSNFAKAPFSF
jgi:hypothetical protein